jgi:hypothetical protein
LMEFPMPLADTLHWHTMIAQPIVANRMR